MSQWKYIDMRCPSCDSRHERLVNKHEPEPELCDAKLLDGRVCAGTLEPTISAPTLVTIVRGNSDFSERQSARLAKRSDEHFKKEGRDEAIERQRMQFKREGLVS